MTPVLGIVCGMATEVRALGRWGEDPGVAVAVSGARPDRAEAESRRLVSNGVQGLLSWGIAGALAPGLKTGDLIRPAVVSGPDGARWDVVLAPGDGVLAGHDRLVRHVEAKAGLRAATGAVAVDMESHRVAHVAAEAGIPFGVIRAISDPADRELPQLAENALTEEGRPRIGAVLLGLARRPLEMGSLIRAGQDSRAALRVLSQVASTEIESLLQELS